MNPFEPEDISNYPECFIAMPITTKGEYLERFNDENHWKFIQDNLIIPAIKRSKFKPIKPLSEGSNLIHSHIFGNLVESPLTIIDLSSHNPNVFLELGIRISANMPMVLIHNGIDPIPFDISSLNVHTYSELLSRQNSENIEKEIDRLSRTIHSTIAINSDSNILWEKLGIENDPYTRVVRTSHGFRKKATDDDISTVSKRVIDDSHSVLHNYEIIKTISDHFIVIFTPTEKLDKERQEYVESQFGYYVNVTIQYNYLNFA